MFLSLVVMPFSGREVADAKLCLKGARINRKSSAAELSDPSRVRMDLDETRTFPIGETIREEVLEQIRHDSDLLAKHNIMDYSMLVGVVSLTMDDTESKPKSKKNRRRKESRQVEEEEGHNARRKTPEFSEVWKTGLPSTAVSNEWYLFGIIDILQDYNSFKKAAHALKVVAYRTSVHLKFTSLPLLQLSNSPFPIQNRVLCVPNTCIFSSVSSLVFPPSTPSITALDSRIIWNITFLSVLRDRKCTTLLNSTSLASAHLLFSFLTFLPSSISS